MARNLSGWVMVLGLTFFLSAVVSYIFRPEGLIVSGPLALYGFMLASSGSISWKDSKWETVSLSLAGLGLLLLVILAPLLLLRAKIALYIWVAAVVLISLGMFGTLLKMQVFAWFDRKDH
ncbi:MAG: hypothetical protein ABEJ69_03950 [Candidatus Nanohaloarchaea archaeon]